MGTLKADNIEKKLSIFVLSSKCMVIWKKMGLMLNWSNKCNDDMIIIDLLNKLTRFIDSLKALESILEYLNIKHWEKGLNLLMLACVKSILTIYNEPWKCLVFNVLG